MNKLLDLTDEVVRAAKAYCLHQTPKHKARLHLALSLYELEKEKESTCQRQRFEPSSYLLASQLNSFIASSVTESSRHTERIKQLVGPLQVDATKR